MSTSINEDTFINKMKLALQLCYKPTDKSMWSDKLDTNQDSYVVYAEFSRYLIENVDWDGQKSKAEDLVSKFWQQFDTNASRTRINAGTELKNVGALDSDEQKKLISEIENVSPEDPEAVEAKYELKSVTLDNMGAVEANTTDTRHIFATITKDNEELKDFSNVTFKVDTKYVKLSSGTQIVISNVPDSLKQISFTVVAYVDGKEIGYKTITLQVNKTEQETPKQDASMTIGNCNVTEGSSTSLDVTIKDENGKPISITNDLQFSFITAETQFGLDVKLEGGKFVLVCPDNVVDKDMGSIVGTLEINIPQGPTVKASFKITIINREVTNNEKIQDAANDIYESMNSWPSSASDYIGDFSKHKDMHTEFGLDKNGNIVFEQAYVTEYYNKLADNIIARIKKSNPQAIEMLGGVNVIKKLIQAAWINTYNTYNSSQKNPTSSFILKVVENFKNIIKSLTSDSKTLTAEQKLELYTMHAAYADTTLTNGLKNFNNGGEVKINYRNPYKTDLEVHLGTSYYDTIYQETMSDLLTKLQKKYSAIDKDKIKEIFREAQYYALETCINNVYDCPYGTGIYSGKIYDDNQDFYKGYNNRDDDGCDIRMRELVPITLYYFDKLLYKYLSEGKI